jgi:hypothetical protein
MQRHKQRKRYTDPQLTLWSKSPSQEANNSSATEEIPHTLWQWKVITVFTSLPLIPFPSQMNAIYDFLPNFFKICSNTVPFTQVPSPPHMPHAPSNSYSLILSP